MIDMSTFIHNMDTCITKIEKTIKQNTSDMNTSEDQNTEKYSDTVDSDADKSGIQIIDEIRTPSTVEAIDVIELHKNSNELKKKQTEMQNIISIINVMVYRIYDFFPSATPMNDIKANIDANEYKHLAEPSTSAKYI